MVVLKAEALEHFVMNIFHFFAQISLWKHVKHEIKTIVLVLGSKTTRVNTF